MNVTLGGGGTMRKNTHEIFVKISIDAKNDSLALTYLPNNAI